MWRVAGYVLPLLAWWAGAQLIDLAVALPPPQTVLWKTGNLFISEGFWIDVSATIIRAVVALGGSALVAIPLGIAAARRPTVAAVVGPSVVLVRAIPFISIILIAVIWFQSGVVPVFVAVLMVFPLLYQAAVTGIGSIDPKLHEMTRSFQLSRLQRIRHLWLPGAAPSILGGVRAANGIAWKVAVAAEVLSVPREGIGASMGEARLYLETEVVLAWTVVLVLLASTTDRLLTFLEELVQRSRTVGSSRDRSPRKQRASRERALISPNLGATPIEGIHLSEVSFRRYTGDQALMERFNVTIDGGSITAIVGPSGVGKTTLLHLVAGLMPPTGGTIKVDPPYPVRTRVVFQEPRLIPWRTIQQNVQLAVPKELPPDACGTIVERSLAMVELVGTMGSMPHELSGGMQQRIGLARALAATPDLLVIDEPLSAVDFAHRAELSELLKNVINEANLTTLIASHDLDLVYSVADRILLIEGRPLRIGLDLVRNGPSWGNESRGHLESVLSQSRFVK